MLAEWKKLNRKAVVYLVHIMQNGTKQFTNHGGSFSPKSPSHMKTRGETDEVCGLGDPELCILLHSKKSKKNCFDPGSTRVMSCGTS